MRRHRIHVDDDPLPPEGGAFELRGAAAHHLGRVLRVRSGDAVALFDGSGREWSGEVRAIARGAVSVELAAPSEPAVEPLREISLVQALVRGERMDQVVQKATELGVSRILPLAAARCTVKLDAARTSKRLAHLRGVAVAAAEQSGRVRVPEVTEVVRLPEVAAATDGLRLVMVPTGGTTLGAVAAAAGTGPVTLMVGPEGGFDQAELASLREHGWTEVVLGPRVLRTETAGPAALAVFTALG